MAEARTITEALALLILLGNVPLKCVAIAGEMIAIDARLCDYDGAKAIKRRATTHEQLGGMLEVYDALLQRVKLSVDSFSQTGNGYALMDALSDIKNKLNTL